MGQSDTKHALVHKLPKKESSLRGILALRRNSAG